MDRNMMYMITAGGAAVLVLLVFLFLLLFDKNGGEEDTESQDVFWDEEAAEPKDSKTSGEKEMAEGPVHVVIDVKGAVREPGVYELKEGQRVIDAIDAAGGMMEEADPAAVNFAEKLHDAMVVRVPEEGENVSAAGSGEGESEKVRINYAEAEELEALPGIGPAKAAAIMAYREEKGFFEKAEDLLNVSGIGEASLEQMKESLSFH
ncbi:helix-hairpin-helix domain-containing protein [Salibacterium halotolerans]|uniref:Competence protein ComEA n=1 Tax=Salibacterium halotolerans TaxID=1884432 RepID=A0A1I5NEI8_9BACI|nr:helix-hairpin-helix domain-containing protein [Salibacterium halotolerans]SFP20102.1 competence protein ComEA [Salibacterium halotolerans]